MIRLARTKIFTKLNVRQTFYRIKLNKEVEDLTTFRTRYESYKYKILSFKLCNESTSFQRFINDALMNYLNDFCTAYVNDILIYFDDSLKHELHVKKVLNRLRAAELQVDIKKSEFNVIFTKFLDFVISTDGILMNSEKMIVIKN